MDVKLLKSCVIACYFCASAWNQASRGVGAEGLGLLGLTPGLHGHVNEVAPPQFDRGPAPMSCQGFAAKLQKP